MPVLDAVQTFAGIANENEFYSHHYLAEVFKGDIKARLDAWEAAEAEHPGDEAHRAPHKRLQAWAQKWFGLRGQVQRSRAAADGDVERWQLFTQIQAGLLQALGYDAPAKQPAQHEWVPGQPIPVWQVQGAKLAVIPAYQPGAENEDLLDHKLQALHYGGEPVPNALHNEAWADMLSGAVFGAEAPPRYVLLAGLDHWLLLDRYKWPNNRALRFDWADILDRKDADTLKACAALLHKDCLAPGEGNSLLQSLDENAHKHAFGVSEDLKFALRKAIELLGNEAARQLDEQASGSKKSVYSGQYKLDPAELSLECLRMVYRLLFMFYIEARPELGYVPIAKSEVYLKGYSLESLRDLEMQPLNTPHARDGFYFDATLRRLFKLVSQGCGLGEPAQTQLGSTVAGAKDTFAMAPLDSRLFDDNTLPLLAKVRFPNHVWQDIVRLMSLTRGQGKGRRSGRVSYQLLSINQLGAVYEALLSYRGFFAAEDLYEVKPAPKKGRGADTDADGEDDDADDAAVDEPTGRRGRAPGDSEADKLESAWFVPATRLSEYHEDERVFDVNEAGHRVLRKHVKGSFIYRLAGRDRQKSASYYTPQVLTQCLVKYALKELLNSDRVKKADDILTITVCEPAMGSAAFLNEAVNQLADAYLERKQAELGKRIPHDEYPQELQKVRMVLADRNVFGVDLNPVAVELAEVSLWLNAIYGEADGQGRPLPARVPWFGYQLFAGNSLIGARAQVFPPGKLLKGAKPAWHEEPPRPVTRAQPRKADEIWHFLLPDPGMADYADKDAKKVYPEDFERLKKWRKAFNTPLAHHEVARLQQLSTKVQELWDEHTKALVRDRARTEDPIDVWPHRKASRDAAADAAQVVVSRAQKEAIRRQGLLNEDGDLATPFRRLKLVMDYWCALWFWPVTQSNTLPSREAWWMEVGAILEGNVVDIAQQPELDLQPTEPQAPQVLVPEVQPTLDGFETQLPLSQAAEQPNLHDRFGQLRISRLREHFPRVPVVEALAAGRRFMHWQLCFADVLLHRGGFDLIVGNPPWLRVEWNDGDFFGEWNPAFAIRNESASQLAKDRVSILSGHPKLGEAWLAELEEAQGFQSFVSSPQNFSLLAGTQPNLYKCFLPVSWGLANQAGFVGLLHEEGIYEDPKGGPIRRAAYRRLRLHFQFQNQKKLFPIGNTRKFSINIYGSKKSAAGFLSLSNLYVPSTVDQSFAQDGSGSPGGIKDASGNWNTVGHRERIIDIDTEKLSSFASLFEADEVGGESDAARLPLLHVAAFTSIINKIASFGVRLSAHRESYHWTVMFDETPSQKLGLIAKDSGKRSRFYEDPSLAILSGPHFTVASPLHQTPKLICDSHRAYLPLDLLEIPSRYLPRTNFIPCADGVRFRSSTDTLPWDGTQHVVDVPRIFIRNMLDPSQVRTLQAAVMPPGVSHVHAVQSIAFKDWQVMLDAAAVLSSLVADFIIRVSGRGGLYELWSILPDIQGDSRLRARIASLNALTEHYSQLWETVFDVEFNDQAWSQSGNAMLPQEFWGNLSTTWVPNCALRTEYSRRMALVEIDVIVAQALSLTLDELQKIYSLQFPVVQRYERESWYDSSGRLIFAPGIGGVGLPRKGGGKTPKTRIRTPEGKVREGNLGWEDLCKDGQWLVPDGTVVTQWVTDDTLPGGPRTVERRYVAPFARANREEDYRIAWAFFEGATE